jgi:antitoxin VapB
MPRTGKVFMTNRSQAVRVPKEYEFSTDEVFIRKEGDVILSPPTHLRADGHHPLGPRIHGPGSFRRRRQHLPPKAIGGFRGISFESQRPLTVW